MRWQVILAAVVGIGGGTLPGMAAADDAAAWQKSGLIARVHFVGTDTVAADPTAGHLNEIAALPETIALREQTSQKLAIAPYNFLRNRTAVTNDETALIRPLIDDVFRAESFVELGDTTNRVPEMAFALRLGDGRARLWSTNVAAVLVAWSGLPVTGVKAEGFDGWELRKHEDPNIFRFFRAGDWVVMGWGQNKLQLLPTVLQRIRATTRPVDPEANNWFDAWVDWPALAPHGLAPTSVQLPAMRLLVQGKKDYVRSELKMKFAAPLGVKLNPWQFPTNMVRNPIVSFTATRGIFPSLNESAAAKRYHLPPLPDQVYAWASGTIPLETHLASPVTDASNYFDQLRPGLLDMVNTFLSNHGPKFVTAGPGPPHSFTAIYTNDQIKIPGVPFVTPYLGIAPRSGNGYLLGGLIPSGRTREPLPPELVSEIMAHTNLVCYGWEITGERLKQWNGLFQLGQFLLNFGLLDPRGAAHKWVAANWSRLGNAGTEVSLRAPDELTVVRDSTLGFTAFELSTLSYWLDAPEFPLGAYGEPSRLGLAPRGPPHPP